MIELRGIDAYNGANAYKNDSGRKTGDLEFERVLGGEVNNTMSVKRNESEQNELESLSVSSEAENITYDFFGKVSRYFKYAGVNIDLSV